MNRALGISIAVAIAALLLFLLSARSTEGVRAETPLTRAVAMVQQASSERHIRRDEVFLSVEGPHDAEAWIAYFFSPLSTRSWGFEGGLEDFPPQRGALVVPEGVAILRSREDELPSDLLESSPAASFQASSRHQLLVSADAATSRVRVRGFSGWKDEVVLDESWDFPRFSD